MKKNIVRNLLAVVAVVAIALPGVLLSGDADARAGAGSSSGSRGGKTNQAPAPTQTAPSAQPMERSATPAQPAQKPAVATPASASQQPGGFMSRNPFLSGMMGGMLGAGLIGMMFGGGFGAGLGGAAGMLGLLLQIALIGGLIYIAVRLIRGRMAGNSPQSAQPAYAYAGTAPQQPQQAQAQPQVQPMARSAELSPGRALLAGSGGSAATAGAASVGLAITENDYSAFEGLLTGIQAAYSDGAIGKLRELATPEMVGYFSEQLSANASRGVENKVADVKLEQGDLSEAWSEAGLEYATVAMRFSMIDVTKRISDGTIVEGNDRVRTEATEIWTFLRSRGGKWILSAIQQV